MKITFQQRLTLSFLLIFIVFSTAIVLVERQRAKRYKTEALTERLDAYTETVWEQWRLNPARGKMDSLLLLLPDNLRITLLDREGKVLFDNVIGEENLIDDHSSRPEIQDAIAQGTGTAIRTSSSNQQPYLYYARDQGNSTIARVALPYDIRVQSFLKLNNAYLYLVLLLFLGGLFFTGYAGTRFGKMIQSLNRLARRLDDRDFDTKDLQLPDNELGEIGHRLIGGFDKIKEKEAQLEREREKLLLHIQTSDEGVCFFNPDKTVMFYNGLFLQYFQSLSVQKIAVGKDILSRDPVWEEMLRFMDSPARGDYFETRVFQQGKEFLTRLNIFEDRSFEIILIDITALEKSRQWKREMTGNIAHELRTPVTSIRGYLELLLHHTPSPEKKQEFLQRAYSQTERLSTLISDMGLLTKMEGGKEFLECGEIPLFPLLERVALDLDDGLQARHDTFKIQVPREVKVWGNEVLLYSIFLNLAGNALQHAGEEVDITVQWQETKNGQAYFSFRDTGSGVPEIHLERIFERFYRVGEGRTRNTGGSGLGLSIVKNAIQHQGGEITVRNHPHGGLEFLLHLPVGKR